jgi:hypothetical protein
MNDWAELDRALHAIAASGRAEVREDGEWLAEFSTLQCELHHESRSPLVRLWSGERNLTRRILKIREQSEERVVLDVQRFGRKRPGRLEFIRAESPRPSGRIGREQFRARLQRLLGEWFPDATVESLTTAVDMEHSFSGVHVRGSMHEGARAWALAAISQEESPAAIEGTLTFGVLWLHWTRRRAQKRSIEGLRVFVPSGTSRFLRERACALRTDARVEIFEFCEGDGTLQKMDPADTGNLQTHLVPRRDAEAFLREARSAAARIPLLEAEMEAVGGRIRTRPIPGSQQVLFSFRGLDFARWSQDGFVFGLDSETRLTRATQPALEKLINRLELHRNSIASETKHSLYRLAPERWLETLVLDDPLRLDAQLDRSHLYSQVPALTASDRGVLDLLAVTNHGRLVVIELKASEDIHMPIQAADYWLRVRRHQREGDLQRYGYFNGIELDSRPPLMWLVAPGLRFHSAMDILLRYLSPEIQVTRVGLAENWRRGIKVVFRQRA